VPLGIIPLGTMNLFARALHIPLDPKTAAWALATGEVATVDVATVNGRTFAHHVTLGLHPRMLMIRERFDYASRLGKLWASAQAFWIALRRPQSLAVRIAIGEESLQRRTAAILVSNNPLGEGHLPYADDLRSGELGLYVARARRPRDLLALAGHVLLGAAATSPLLERRFAEALDIWPAQNPVFASIDGELVRLDAPLRFALLLRAVTVIHPDPNPRAFIAGNGTAADPLSSQATRVPTMTEEVTKAEARQGDSRRLTLTVLFVGLPAAVILLTALFFAWAT
jgi:diacylglycerol kinase family enzyme